jgi:hypothetical protein
MGDIQFNGTPEEWDPLVKKNKEQVFDRSKYIAGIDPYAKQETLEEAAEKFADDCTLVSDAAAYKGFIEGAKWQQERMYSEEEVYNILVEHTIELFKGQPCTLDEFFEQFKKK